MKVLFDHNVPRKLRRQLGGHDVRTAREMGWAELENGELLAVAEATGFEVMVTADKNMSYQQRLKDRRLAIVVLSDNDWIVVKESAELISLAIERAEPGSFQFVLVGR